MFYMSCVVMFITYFIADQMYFKDITRIMKNSTHKNHVFPLYIVID